MHVYFLLTHITYVLFVHKRMINSPIHKFCSKNMSVMRVCNLGNELIWCGGSLLGSKCWSPQILVPRIPSKATEGPREKGRVLRGIDCRLSWVYWRYQAVTGTQGVRNLYTTYLATAAPWSATANIPYSSTQFLQQAITIITHTHPTFTQHFLTCTSLHTTRTYRPPRRSCHAYLEFWCKPRSQLVNNSRHHQQYHLRSVPSCLAAHHHCLIIMLWCNY